MQRLRQERGAVSVTVALLIVPLIAFAAIAIDIAAMHAERQQLQTGADAAALAIAQDCARDACEDPGHTAQEFATANTNSEATATVDPVPTPASGQVTVQNSGLRGHWFAPVLGFDETAITASASAGWGAPSGGTSMLPLALSYCEWWNQTGGGTPSGSTARTIYLAGTGPTPGCPGPSGTVPGGFGWLRTDPGTCNVTTAIMQTLPTDTGVSVSSGCTPADFVALQNSTVLLPIFDRTEGTGSGARYRVYGYAALTITGYSFGGQYRWNNPCSGDARCVRGYFTELVDLSDAFDYSPAAPELGAAIVSLLPGPE
ncbi:pilus assembly protein TadG-related protein [Bogoriella caseilytica]|uniref:Putative Flp pilus-assembly TadE/G-like protein n=1 Tax=Bogoriella caseilytica TaxID=56055 RepID=A0A3N2BDA8_9MICO|nr:pilus assembly protein TadG-related protein [Bogoriella caseilytica]ROR73243.1 putative Flp pilus-assembly TadE/G-like protein [Bogoriella caseilytica]